jgi:transcriptional regulator with XRE-family HTH domain
MRFGKQLSIKRKKLKLSTEEFAKTCELSRSYITLIENGKRFPSKKILSKIALALHVKTNIVLNWYLEDLREEIQKNL